MILDKGARADRAGFFCLAAALGGGARAAQVYPGCAQPGPTRAKSGGSIRSTARRRRPAASASQAAPWNSLNGVISGSSGTPVLGAGYTRPLLSSVPYFHVVDGKRVTSRTETRQPAGPARRHDQADERQLRRHRHRRLHAAGRQLRLRHGRGRAGPDAGVLDPVHPLDQQVGVQRHQGAEPVRHEQ